MIEYPYLDRSSIRTDVRTPAHGDSEYMNGLYALKPRFSEALTGVRRHCITAGISPSLLTWLGVLAGVGAGITLATQGPGIVTALLVGALVVVRLACANLDGGVARQTGTSTPWGAVENELGDRLADFALLAGLVWLLPLSWAGFVLLAATLPSWIALSVAAAGGTRRNGGLMGKTERCAVAVFAALTGLGVRRRRSDHRRIGVDGSGSARARGA